MSYTARSGTDAVVQDWDGSVIGPENTDAWAAYQSWLAAGNTVNSYVPPPTPVPQVISDRQFYQQAALQSIIMQAEALAAVQTGAIPTILMNIVNGIADPTQQFAAKMILSGATQFERNNPLTASIGTALGWTPAQIDAFFIAASAL